MTEYTPQTPAEQYFYDALWKYANPAGDGELGGKAAVQFFQMSGVDIGILKQIWGLSTPTASMNREQFNSAIRYITMMQQGEIPLSKERLRTSSKVNLGLPKFNAIDIPPYKAPVAAPAINPALYAITPKDHVKYHELFLTYDTDKDGFLTYDECMNIFRQSGVDPQALTAIYAMSDDDKDAKLTSKEFSVAFHLIICIGKKNLPLPTAIPQMLKGFLLNAPAVPTSAPPPAAAAPVPGPVPAPAPSTQFTPVHASPTVPASSSGFDSFSAPSAPAAAPTGFDAFDLMGDSAGSASSGTLPPLADFGRNSPVTAAAPPAAPPAASVFGGFPPATAPAPAAVPQYQQQQQPPRAAAVPVAVAAPPAGASSYNKGLTYSENDEYELSQSIDAIKAITKKSLTSQETMLDNNGKSVSSLQALKQKLHIDKLSLEATVSNADINTKESIARLEATIAEVGQLTEQLKELRGKLDHAQKTQLNVEAGHSKVNSEKAALVRAIEDVMKQLAVANGDVITKTNEANATQFDVNLVKQSNNSLGEQEAQLKHTAADLSNEIATLKHILGCVSGQRDQALRQVGTAHAKMLSAHSALKQENEVQSAKQTSVNKLNRQVAALKSDKQHLLTEIEHHTDNGDADPHYQHDSDAEEAHFGYDDTFEEKHSSFTAESNHNSSSYKSFNEHNEDDAFAAAGASHQAASQEDPFSAAVLDASGGFGDNDAFGSSASATASAAGAVGVSSPSHSDAFSHIALPSTTKDAFDDDAFSTLSPGSGKPFSDSGVAFDSFPTATATTVGIAAAADGADSDPFGSSADPFSSTVGVAAGEAAFDSFGDAVAAPPTVGTGTSDFDDFSSTPATSHKAAATSASAFDSFGTAPVSSGFDDFSATPSAGLDAFDAFGSSTAAAAATAPSSGGAFDAFGADPAPSSDGFDAFGSAATAVSADAFDGFGPAAVLTPPGSSTAAAAAAGSDAFDAFGSAGTAAGSTGDEDPFASFGGEKPADDPFAF